MIHKFTKDVYDWLAIAGSLQGDTTKLNLAFTLVKEEISELDEAILKRDKDLICDSIIDSFWTILNVAYFYGVSPEEVNNWIEKVSTSNWSKFCKNEKEAQITVDLYRTGTHPDKRGQIIECDYEKSGEFWIVKRPDGKILKSYQYLSVDKL